MCVFYNRRGVKGRNAPGLIPIEKRGEDAVQVGAGADEEEDDEEEGLEFEDAELEGGEVRT